MLAGSLAGAASAVVTNPLEVVKIRMQNQAETSSSSTAGTDAAGKLAKGRKGWDEGPYRGTFRSLIRIHRSEGLRGLYKGLPQTLLGYLPNWAIYFTVYDAAKSGWERTLDGAKTRSPTLVHVLSAVTAGIVATSATNPCWVLRTRFMTMSHPNSPYTYRSTWDAITTIYRTEGLSAFYKGWAPSLMGVSHVAVQFPLYEWARVGGWGSRLLAFFTGRPSADVSDRPGVPTSADVLVASALSKVVASGVTYPHEIVRTRLHTHVAASHPPLPVPSHHLLPRIPLPSEPSPPPPEPTVASVVRSIYRTAGLGGFYRGFGTNLVKTVPAAVVTMGTYEGVRWWSEGVKRDW
ncbi:mitochondrial carrier [Gonapodya prolifera JEL478]|uniref:Mitochondrial carrier n=1 Tax=Gonapodya prolifera (strain JEL478) TaxID=1344416 RepID=A0A139AMZ3_GONPJ|nr:mitochondrial carrier [Gonapodya prolifera JEL478]|eukprot:KXS18088.1 mitochondrial carrier [Gonapodya prolifera JEL478]